MTSLFSNVFSSPAGAQIERATKEDVDPDRKATLHAAICYEITSTPDGPKDAIKAFKRRLFHNKNWRTVLSALALLELVCRECGRDIQLLIAHREFLQSLVNLTLPKASSPTIVRDFVLLVIQKWARDFEHVHELVTICAMYETLKQKGTDFPARELGDIVPLIVMPQGTLSPEQGRLAAMAARGNDSPQPRRQGSTRHQGSPPPVAAAAVPAAAQPAPASAPAAPAGPGPVAPDTQQETKLRSEMEIVRVNTGVFRALLDELVPGSEPLADFQLLQDLNSTCRAMRSRIVELIDRISHDELICDLLQANDELNNAFTAYDDYVARRNTMATGTAAPPVATGAMPSSEPAAVDPEVSLLDLDSLPADTFTAAAPPPVVAMGAMSLAEPTAQVNDADDDDDGFDSFAQSRGYGAAPAPVTAPSDRNPFATDIRASPVRIATSPNVQPVTSSEFDDFLASRSNTVGAPVPGGVSLQPTNGFEPLVPSPARAQAAPPAAAVPGTDSSLQELLDFAAPAPAAVMQSQAGGAAGAPRGRPAMQTHDPNEDLFGF